MFRKLKFWAIFLWMAWLGGANVLQAQITSWDQLYNAFQNGGAVTLTPAQAAVDDITSDGGDLTLVSPTQMIQADGSMYLGGNSKWITDNYGARSRDGHGTVANFQSESKTRDVNLAVSSPCPWCELQDRINNASNGSTIQLDSDCTANLSPHSHYDTQKDCDICLFVPEGKNITIDLNGHTIDRNLADQEAMENGEVFHVAQGASLTITDSSINTETPYGKGLVTGGNNDSDGGGIHNVGVFYLNGGNISLNKTNGLGGGVFNKEGNATFEMNGGAILENVAASAGGGVCNKNTFTMTGGLIDHNEAIGVEYGGGGLYNDDNSTFVMAGGTISNNIGDLGGAIQNFGIATIYGGNIEGNTANLSGNGIFQNGSMNLSGNPVFGTNDVVYLPEGKVITKAGDVDGSVLVPVKVENESNGRDILVSSTEHNVVKSDLSRMNVMIENTNVPRLSKVFTSADAVTSMPVIELFACLWSEYVIACPETGYSVTDGNATISSKEGLAWLISVVNGLNGQAGNNFSGKTVTLTNNVDMTEHIWEAIGTATHPFLGTFTSNGSTICGLHNNADYGVAGLFGTVNGGKLQNVFVTSCDFVNRTSQTGGHIGIVADTITNGAIVESCEVMGKISTASSSIIAGGLVGLVDAGSELHSSMSLAEVCGSHIGGLVGETRGSTNNCISYPDFYCTELGTGSNYAAGLVGISSGSVENNYVRFNTHSNWYVPSLGQLRMLFGMETIFLTSVSSWKSMTVHDDALYLTSSLHDANHVYVIDCRLPSTNGGAGNIGSDDINNLHYVRLVGNYVGSGHHEGDIINVDGRLGIVFHVNDDDTGGWVAALSDLDINGTTKFKFCTSSAAASMSAYYNTDDYGDPVYIDNIEHDYAFGNNGKLFCETLSNAESASSDNVIGKMKAENWPIMQFEYTNGSILRECYHLLPTSEYALVNSGSTTDCGQYTTTTVPYAYAEIGCMVGSNRMMDLMNAWVDAKNALKYAAWAQPITKGINTDYPVLKFKDFNTMANDGATPYLYYGDLDAQLGTYTSSGQTVFFYGSKESSSANNLSSAATLYVDQDAALASGAKLKGYTSRLLDNPSKRWHLYASPLQDSKIGFKYGKADEVKWNEETNPCEIVLADNPQSIFPTGTPIESMDLYCFYEKEYHWLNLKRNRLSHWHMNKHDANIAYNENDNLDNDAATNNSVLVQGKGYLTSIEAKSYLQSNGQFSDGTVTMPVTVLAGTMNAGQGIQANEGTELKGYNLLGNPYQSYLSFARFAEVNGTLWAESTTPSYAVFDAESGSYIPGTAAEISKGSFAAQGDINMHQGFFIVADNAGTATFDNTMRSVVPLSGTHFRGEELAYPLVNLVVTDATGTGDVAVVEFDRPEYNSAAKMKNIGADGKVYFHHNGDDCALLFLDEPTDHLPVHFEAIADGSYTMTWSTANADFSYLHLIDNMTGMDIDMLTSESYTFTATTDDYKSRFKLMFAYTGIDENDDTELAEVFAFVHDGNLIVNGEGMLEVIDMCGRCIVNTELTDAQNTVSLPQTASGLYVLRLINDNKSKVQKIVVR